MKQKLDIQQYPRIMINFNPRIPKLKKSEDKTKINVRYCLIEPFTFVHIYWNPKIYELVYEIEEPLLTNEEEKYKEEITSVMKEMIDFDGIIEKEPEKLLKYIDTRFKFLAIELGMEIPYESYVKVYYYLCRDFLGFNEAEPLLRDYFVEDIECNGIGIPIYIVHRVYRNLKTNIVFKTNEKLESFVEKLSQRCGKYISYSKPILDGSLADGSRVNATYTKDITSKGPTFCFKEGKVQLNDGRIKDVKKLFEECKKNFGSRIENENEIVDVSNLDCCGVDEKNLEQKNSTVSSIIKLKAPDKLVRIKLGDGGEVETTLDHKFHVVRESLETIEAKDLKEGMIIPVPKKIISRGYKQKINVYQLIKDFSYHKKICVISTPAIKEIISNEISSYPSEKYRTIMSEKYGVGNSYFYEIISRGSSVSFSVMDQICANQKVDLSKIEDLFINIYGGGTKNKSKTLKIPKEVDEDLAYITGVLISDGHISKNSIDFSCYEEGIKNSVKEKLIKLFGKFESYYNDNRIYLCNSFVPYFFNKVFGIPIGKKTHIVEIPEIILKSENNAISSFIKGLFDGDGTVSSGLSYKTYSKNLSEGLTYALARLGIFSYLRKSKEGYRVNIPSPYYEIYNDKIGFDSISKKELLKKMIGKQFGNDRKKFIRHDRIPGMPIISIIRKLGIINKEIIKDCGVSFNRLYYTTFSRSFAQKLIQEIKKHKNSYLVKKEIDYIKWMLNSGQEFVKIEEVGIVDNNEPVYDIELEPCKFFVAGNKPMNMFDTIRKFTKEPWTPPQLINFNTLSPEMVAYLWILIEHKMNILITGGTSSGKTTLLNALAFFIPPEARVVSIEDSITGDSKIIIKENNKIKQVTIKEFVDKKINAEVMTLDEKGRIKWIKPSDYIKHKIKKDIYEITTSTGRKIKVTKDHSLFSLGDYGIKEIKPTELSEGKSFIAVPRKLPIEFEDKKEINLIENLNEFKEFFLQGEPIKKIFEKYSRENLGVKKERYRWWKNNNIIKIQDFLDLDVEFNYEELKQLRIKSKNKAAIPIIFPIIKEFLEFLGLWIGDGSYDNYNKNSVIVSNTDEECRQIIIKIADFLNSRYSIMNDKETSLRIHNTIFYKMMKNVLKFDGYSKTKEIPEFIYNLSNNQIKNFLRGYFSADGCVKKYEVSCASQSYELLTGIQSLFLRLGIISRINDFERKDKCINMSISTSENIELFKKIGFLQERKNRPLILINKKAHHASSDVIPLTKQSLKNLNSISNERLQWRYMKEMQRIGRRYMQKIAPMNSEFNDLSHNDILWDKVKKIKKINSDEIEVFDLSIPKHEKFLCNNIFVHNTRELNLPRENWLPSVVRNATGLKNIGEVDLFSLLRSSFRQNPDYVIVGEVRGKEAYVLFQGMASGHSSISTMHADSVDTVIKRLETPPIELSPTLLNILDSVCIMTHAVVKKQETRRLKEIVEIIKIDPDGIAMTNTPFVWNPKNDEFYSKKDSKIFEKISTRYGKSVDEINLEFKKRVQLIYKIFQSRIFEFQRFQDVITEYYKRPEEVLRKFGVR